MARKRSSEAGAPTTVWFKPDDRKRLNRLRGEYGLGASAAMRVALVLLERQLAEDVGRHGPQPTEEEQD